MPDEAAAQILRLRRAGGSPGVDASWLSAQLRQAGGSAGNGSCAEWAAPSETVALNERSSCAGRAVVPSKIARPGEAAAPGWRLRLER